MPNSGSSSQCEDRGELRRAWALGVRKSELSERSDATSQIVVLGHSLPGRICTLGALVYAGADSITRWNSNEGGPYETAGVLPHSDGRRAIHFLSRGRTSRRSHNSSSARPSIVVADV